jgi:hypothetical protein
MVFRIKNGIRIFHDRWDFEKAIFWFLPIVIGFTIVFGFFAGVKGAFVGFFYGLTSGGFLIYESLPEDKKER